MTACSSIITARMCLLGKRHCTTVFTLLYESQQPRIDNRINKAFSSCEEVYGSQLHLLK